MLEYVALILLLLSITAIFYIFIYIHDIPHRIAKKRHHPQEEAIHYACWLSLFTLHAIWPIVFLWAVAGRRAILVEIENGGRVGPDGSASAASGGSAALQAEIADLRERLASLEAKSLGGDGKKKGA